MNCAAVDGSAADTLIVRDAVAVCPVSLVTVSKTVNVAARVYWWTTVTPVAVVLSPKSQLKIPPAPTVDVDALKEISSLTPGEVGEFVNRATGCTDAAKSAALNVT